MPYLLLIRHGDYDYADARPENRGQVLTKLGLQQAKATAEWLAGCGNRVEAVRSSDFVRAQQTAAVIAQALPGARVFKSETLRECRDVYYQDHQQVPSSADTAYAELLECAAASPYANVIVCHANLIRYLLSRLLAWPRKTWDRTVIPNCSVSIIEFGASRGSRPRALSVAAQEHLPQRLREQL